MAFALRCVRPSCRASLAHFSTSTTRFLDSTTWNETLYEQSREVTVQGDSTEIADPESRKTSKNPMAPAVRKPKPQEDAKNLAPQRPLYHLHMKSGKNNTLMAFTNDKGLIIAQTSGGMCGFKGSNRRTFEAGYQCTVRMFQRIVEQMGVFEVANLRAQSKHQEAQRLDNELRREAELNAKIDLAKEAGDEEQVRVLESEKPDGRYDIVKPPFDLAIALKGFGQGRLALLEAFKGPEGDRVRKIVVSIADQTPIKIGGTRAKKARRL